MNVRTMTLEALAPGVALSVAVAVASWVMALGEVRLFGHAIIEALVLAIILGMIIRTLWTPSERAAKRIKPGVTFTAKPVLEVAICLLGISVNLPELLKAGPSLAVGIIGLVVIGLTGSYLIGRAFGLPHKLAVLVACGNSICGNAAIAAIAPVIDADAEHIAASIAFTAIVGVAMVIGLPYLVHPLGFSLYQYGVFAGLTVYAVPQVLAATFPVGLLSVEVGTLVKLVRVLMLGPVVLFFAVRQRAASRVHGQHERENHESVSKPRFSITRYVPWFIIGFLVLAALRSFNVIPVAAVVPTRQASTWLTVASLAALGLGVDLKAITKVGPTVVMTVMGSILGLMALSFGLIRVLGI